MTDTLTLITKIVTDYMMLDEPISPNANIYDQGCDELDHIGILMAIEDAFDIPEFTDAEHEAAKTVADLVGLVEGKTQAVEA